MQGAVQSGGGTRSRFVIWLNGSNPMFNLRRRRDFGSLHYGDTRWSNRVPDTIRPRHSHHDQAGYSVSRRYARNQCVGIFFDRFVHDSAHRTVPTAPQLASVAGGWLSRWLHDLFELRVGNAEPNQRWRPVARPFQRCRKRFAWICRCLARLDHRGKTLSLCLDRGSDRKGGAHVGEGRREEGHDLRQ